MLLLVFNFKVPPPWQYLVPEDLGVQATESYYILPHLY